MNQNQKSPSRRALSVLATNKYQVARSNLLLVVVLTTLNILLGALNANTYLLFSASIPHFIVEFASVAVIAPEEVGLTAPIENAASFMIVAAVIAAVLTIPYLLCWIFSKKHYGWMIAALVFFSLDTLCLFLLFDFIYMIPDILIHAWVLVYLVMGVKNGVTVSRNSKIAAENDPIVSTFTVTQDDSMADRHDIPAESAGETSSTYDTAFDTSVLRPASEAEGKKCKVYVETMYSNHRILYRRVGDMEELVVDNYVYAEMPRPKKSATMRATVYGLQIEVGVAQSANMIMVGNRIVATTTRWF